MRRRTLQELSAEALTAQTERKEQADQLREMVLTEREHALQELADMVSASLTEEGLDLTGATLAVDIAVDDAGRWERYDVGWLPTSWFRISVTIPEHQPLWRYYRRQGKSDEYLADPDWEVTRGSITLHETDIGMALIEARRGWQEQQEWKRRDREAQAEREAAALARQAAQAAAAREALAQQAAMRARRADAAERLAEIVRGDEVLMRLAELMVAIIDDREAVAEQLFEEA